MLQKILHSEMCRHVCNGNVTVMLNSGENVLCVCLCGWLSSATALIYANSSNKLWNFQSSSTNRNNLRLYKSTKFYYAWWNLCNCFVVHYIKLLLLVGKPRASRWIEAILDICLNYSISAPHVNRFILNENVLKCIAPKNHWKSKNCWTAHCKTALLSFSSIKMDFEMMPTCNSNSLKSALAIICTSTSAF